MSNAHHSEMGAAGVLGFLGFGHFAKTLADAEPWLASLSYIAALIVACVTIFYKVRNRGK
jgi:hypothetical protein